MNHKIFLIATLLSLNVSLSIYSSEQEPKWLTETKKGTPVQAERDLIIEAKKQSSTEMMQQGSTPQKIRYSINLMWINKKLDEDQYYIHPSKNESDLEKNFLSHIFKWAKANPDGRINVWFDSELTPLKAIKDTLRLIKKHEPSTITNIKFRDIRKIKKILDHPKIFSDKIPIYFRVDILRPIIALNSLTHEVDYCVFADLDMEPLSKEQLFDSETLRKLSQDGIVMAKSATSNGFENGFQIISNDQSCLLDAMEFALVDLNIQRAYNALKGNFKPLAMSSRQRPLTSIEAIEQAVFFSYVPMFQYFYHLAERTKLLIVGGSIMNPTEREYDQNKDGFTPFKLEEMTNPFELTSSIPIAIPTKEVKLPQSSFVDREIMWEKMYRKAYSSNNQQ